VSSSLRENRVAFAVAAAGAAVALAVGGCGSSKSSGLSKQDLVKKANPICKRHYDKIIAGRNKLFAGGGLPDPRKLTNGVVLPQYTAQIRELRRLKPSKDVKGAYEKWLADSEATRTKLQRNPAMLTNAANFKAVNGEADKLGLSSLCHIGPG
jgi:hypothetical protein